MKILGQLQELGMVDFIDNQRAVRLHDDDKTVHLLKVFSAVCDLESLKLLLEPLSGRGMLFGSRSTGRARSDSDYDLFVVSETPEEVSKIAAGHPLGKRLEVVAWTPDQFDHIDRDDPGLKAKLAKGIVLWGPDW